VIGSSGTQQEVTSVSSSQRLDAPSLKSGFAEDQGAASRSDASVDRGAEQSRELATPTAPSSVSSSSAVEQTPNIRNIQSVFPPSSSNVDRPSGASDNNDPFKERQLIRVSAERIVTASASRGSWFWGSPKASDAGVNAKTASTGASKKNAKKKGMISDRLEQGESVKTTGADKLVDKREVSGILQPDRNSATPKIEPSAELLPRRDAPTAASNDPSAFVNSENSPETESEGHTVFAGAFLLPETSLTSPGPRPTDVTDSSQVAAARKWTQSLSYEGPYASIDRRTSSIENNSPQQDTEIKNVLAGAFLLPETSLASPTLPESTLEQVVSPDASRRSRGVPSGNVRVREQSASSLSRQSSQAESRYDDSYVERLLRDKAGLEGRLEMLERENKNMLAEQLELKARMAAAEEQVKASSATGQGLALDRNSLVADVETLRQNRARLEAVIMDAHKLLEEKDIEVRTLERDLELARLAGEKHLERVADGRKQLTARDATIRDLKAKIAELYVQSQTSDQSKQITEGELLAIKADIAALTEAKEWYANQLRAAQKDRNRLQTEAAAAKKETIAASVSAERLRAENARMKRNLAEVEQRVLAEKRKLAHHLEEIEHDMMEREAAFAAQLKQATELTEDRSPAVYAASDGGQEEMEMLKNELKRFKELAEGMRHENVDLSRRLALSQQCVVERDDTIKQLESDREAAEVRAESAEHDAALRAETIRQLESERAELQTQLETSSDEKRVIDQSLQTLKQNTATLELGFRKMQQDLLTKSAEVEKMTSVKVSDIYQRLSEIPSTDAGIQLVPLAGRDDKTKAVERLVESDLAVEQLQRATAPESDQASLLRRPQVSVEIQTEPVELQSSATAVSEERLAGQSTDRADYSVFRQPESINIVEYGVSETSGVAFESADHEFARAEIRRLQLAYTEQLHKVEDMQSLLVCAEAKLSAAQQEREAVDRGITGSALCQNPSRIKPGCSHVQQVRGIGAAASGFSRVKSLGSSNCLRKVTGMPCRFTAVP
jgi:hypothetical protein